MNSASVEFFRNATGTSAGFRWPGGRGQFQVVATFGGGFVNLETLAPDGATWLTVASATTNSSLPFELPPCTVRGVCNTATAVYAQASRIPE